jgi:hypothetical protein
VAARSTNFHKIAVQTTGVFDYTVPTGKVAAVTSASYAKTIANTPVSVYMGFFAPGDANVSLCDAQVFSGVTVVEVANHQLRVVLQAGWTLRMARLSAAGTWSAQASGFLYDA